MKAMVLAAGRGERMGALTSHCPKPLLRVAGRALIDHVLEALVRAGVREVVINVGYLGRQIETHLAQGAPGGLAIAFSREPEQPLGTGAGIARALPLLGLGPFLLCNADVLADFDFAALLAAGLPGPLLGHLLLVENPAHHRAGDFWYRQGKVLPENARPPASDAARLTYGGAALISPALFDLVGPGAQRFELAPLLRRAAELGKLAASRHTGYWFDVGTAGRLAAAEAALGGGAAGIRSN